MTAGAGAVVALAQVPPTRQALLKLKGPGEGPSAEQRRRGGFGSGSWRAAARESCTEVSGGDPGYDETSKMLAESALCLAFDDLPERAGSSRRRSRWAMRCAGGSRRPGSSSRCSMAGSKAPPSGAADQSTKAPPSGAAEPID